MLAELRRRLRAGEAALVVQALYGLGGVGKTQLAIEYAHRFAADYDLVWWIDAEQPVLIPDQLAGLAARLDLPAGPTVAATVDRLLAELGGRDRWLLIFDNAERPQDIADYRPGGAGHVLITSRAPGWGALGGRLEVDVLARAETVALLRARIPAMGEELADKLAAELGDLPLAAAQAAGYLEQTDLPAGGLSAPVPHPPSRPARPRRRGGLLRADRHRLGAVAGAAQRRGPGRGAAAGAGRLPRPRTHSAVADSATTPTCWASRCAPPPPTPTPSPTPSARWSATRWPAATPTASRCTGWCRRSSASSFLPTGSRPPPTGRWRCWPPPPPATRTNPASWAGYAQLAPHVLAAGPLVDSSPAGRQLVLDTARYLRAHGDSSGSRAVCEQLLDRWRAILGPDHPDTLTAASRFSLALIQLGEAEPARALGEDTLQRCRRVLGPDHPTTLVAAAALTAGPEHGWAKAEPARALGEDTLQRCRRVLGPDHPITLEPRLSRKGIGRDPKREPAAQANSYLRCRGPHRWTPTRRGGRHRLPTA